MYPCPICRSRLGSFLLVLLILFIFSWKEAGAKSSTTFRLRYFAGHRVNPSENTSWNAYHVVWHGFGVGSSDLVINKEEGSYEDRIKLNYQELSYTFGQDLTLMLGMGGTTESSEATTTLKNTSLTWKAKSLSGTPTYFMLVGFEILGFLELVVGSRVTSYKLFDFERTDSGSTTWLSRTVEGKTFMVMTGMGIVF